MSRNKDKHEGASGRTYHIMSEAERASGRRGGWTTLEVTGGVRALAPQLFQLTHLTALYLNDNSLQRIPPDINQLVNLHTLDISNNKLRSLPAELGDLIQLRELHLHNNYLRVLPYELGKLFHLQLLGLGGNPLSKEMLSIYNDNNGTAKLLTYMLDNLQEYAAKMSYLEKVDRYLDSLKVGKSALVDSWFMMSSPMPLFSVVVAYLILIRIGPRIMKNRQPLQMNRLIAYYNASQVLLAIVICFKVFKLNLFRDGIIYAGCRYPSNTQNVMLLDLGWWYFFAKFTELLDTVFFVLRKKDSQVTFLHVYHHVIMALYSWSYLKFAAGGEGAVLALLNSIVHVVMYSYYLLSGLGPRFQKYLWWKKYVTKLQLIQFILMLTYCAWTHFSPRCQYASGFTYFICTNITIFLFLFLNFYSKSYKKRNLDKKNVEKELKEEYNKSHSNTKTNGVCKNGVNNKKENGVHGNDCKSVPNIEEIPCEVNKACGDYVKDGKFFLSRRTAKAAYGAEYDFDSIIKK